MPRPLGRVLRAAEAGLYADAAGALAFADAEAAKRREATAADLAAWRAQAAATAQAEAAARAADLLARTEAEIQRSLHRLLPEVAEAIAMGVAKVIAGLDVAEAVAAAAQRALGDIAERHAVTVRVAATAANATRARLAPLGAGVRVVADPDLASDDCVLETSAGFIRAGLGPQIAAVQAALLEAAQDGAG